MDYWLAPRRWNHPYNKRVGYQQTVVSLKVCGILRPQLGGDQTFKNFNGKCPFYL